MGKTRWASSGAVEQEGMLPISHCKFCGHDIVWATSSRTGNRYPVTVSIGERGRRYYVKANAHGDDCRRTLANRELERQRDLQLEAGIAWLRARDAAIGNPSDPIHEVRTPEQMLEWYDKQQGENR